MEGAELPPLSFVMRFARWVLFLFVAAGIFAAVPAKKSAPAKKSRQAVVTKKSSTRTAARKGSPTGAKRTGKAGARQVASRRPAVQSQPTPERYKEIQDALAQKGYLKSEPNGVWDAQSVEALKQFQADKNLPPTGKLTALSLGGLGLGSKTAGTVLPSPAVALPSATTEPPPRR